MAFGIGQVVTHSGLAIMAKRMLGATPAQAEPKFLALGTGATTAARTAAVTDTALSAELTEGRSGTNAGTTVTVNYTNDSYNVVNTIVMTGTRAIDESALFDQLASGGNMFTSSTFAVLNLTLGDSFGQNWTITNG